MPLSERERFALKTTVWGWFGDIIQNREYTKASFDPIQVRAKGIDARVHKMATNLREIIDGNRNNNKPRVCLLRAIEILRARCAPPQLQTAVAEMGGNDSLQIQYEDWLKLHRQLRAVFQVVFSELSTLAPARPRRPAASCSPSAPAEGTEFLHLHPLGGQLSLSKPQN